MKLYEKLLSTVVKKKKTKIVVVHLENIQTMQSTYAIIRFTSVSNFLSSGEWCYIWSTFSTRCFIGRIISFLLFTLGFSGRINNFSAFHRLPRFVNNFPPDDIICFGLLNFRLCSLTVGSDRLCSSLKLEVCWL